MKQNLNFLKVVRCIFLLLCFVLSNKFLLSQVSVTNTNNATILAQKLAGQGVQISNATVQCNPNQSGIFVSTSSLLTMDSGIVLTTGLASTSGTVYGVNTIQNNLASINQGTNGDADLENLAGNGISTFDKCILEFDFKTDGDSVFFKYRFGSEEYPQYNCTYYNDIFGFIISGPGFATPTNLALIPSTTIPVAINTVNSGVVTAGGNISNCTSMGVGSPFTSYYTDNTGGLQLSYQGFTNLFKVKAQVFPCSTYHLKLAIADGFDHILDSGVFLESGSLVSNTVKLQVATDSISSNVPYVFEGCDTAIIKIIRKNIQTFVTADTVQIQITGTALNGTDYPTINTTYFFSNSLADSVKTILLGPINDLITEGTETVNIILFDKCGNPADTVTIEIKDPPKFTLLNNDTTICLGSSVQVVGTQDAGLQFSWSPTNGVLSSNTFLTTITPSVTTTYTLTSSYGNCALIKDSFKISVEPTPVLNLSATHVNCFGQTNGSITAFSTVSSSPFSVLLSPSSAIASSSPASFNNLSAGVYTVTVTSALGCTKTNTITVTQPLLYNWNTFQVVNIACNAGNVGQINVTTSGGTPSSTYTLQPVGTANSTGVFSGLPSGSFTINAVDAKGCTLSSVVNISQVTSLAWSNVNVQNISCFGLANGNVNASVSGGVGIVNYTLLPSGITNNNGSFSNLGVNTYTVNAIDANGCTGSTVFSITQPPILNITSTNVTNVLCNGASTGAINIGTTGGTPILSFSTTPATSTNNNGLFNNILAGNYTVNITDANGCTRTTALVISQPPAISFSSVNFINPSCNPGNNGSIAVTGVGGTGSLTYSINGGAFVSNGNFSSLTAGTYTITIQDGNNCTLTTTVTIAITNAPILNNNTIQVLCANTLGTINVSATNGTPIYTYTLLPNNISNTVGIFNAVGAGVYTVNVIDANGCTSSIVITLTMPPEMQWQSFNVTNVPCSGVGTGSINATATGGTGLITYNLMPGNINNNSGVFNSLLINTYTVTATDINGCSVSSIVNIAQSPSLNATIANISNITCFSLSNGSVDINTTGGVGAVSYVKIPSGQTNSTGIFNSLQPNTYTVTATDITGCASSVVFTITQPNALLISNIITSPPSCVPGADGSIQANALGGIPVYQYSLNAGSFQLSNTFNTLSIGQYTIAVQDANGCTASSTVNLTNPNAPIIDSVAIVSPLCFSNNNGNITTYISGSTGVLNYSLNPVGLNNNTGIFNNLNAGFYTVVVTSSNNCTTSSNIQIVQPNALNWINTNISNITCNGLINGSATLTANGGTGLILYTINTGASNNTGVFNNLAVGNYTILATDANNCSISTSISISQPSILQIDSFAISNIICNGASTGSAFIQVIGGTGLFLYTLNPTGLNNFTGSFNNIPANTYTLLASDANSCTISTIFNITQPSAINISNISNTIPSCNPGNNASITVTASGGVGGLTYSLNNVLYQLSNTFTSIGVSVYTVYVKDANNCIRTSTVNVSNPALPQILSSSTTNVLCFSQNTGAVIVNASGGVGVLNYNLLPNNIVNSTGNYNGLLAGIYTVVVNDVNNCSATVLATITEPLPFIWDSVNSRDISCYGGSNGLVTSHASGGTGTITYTLLPLGISNTNGAFLGLAMGAYTLLATDSNGCVISSTFLINQSPQIIWTSVTATPVTCIGANNGVISVAVTGGVPSFSFKLQPLNINNTTGVFAGLSAGVYTVIAKDDFGCTISTTVNLTQINPIQITNITKTDASCSPGCDASAIVSAGGGTGAYMYSNNGSAFAISNTFNNLCANTYTVVAQDGNGCTASSIYNINTTIGPSAVTVSKTNIVCFGQTNGSLIYGAIGGTPTFSFNLMPNNTTTPNGVFNNLTAGVYSVTITDSKGCTISHVDTIIQPLLLQINSVSVTHVLCNGNSTGVLNTNASGGSGILNYTLQPNAISNFTGLFNSLNANTYTILVNDANNCTASSVSTITEPPVLQINSLTNTDVICNGQNNGSISINASGGAGGIVYNLLPNNIFNTTGNFNLLSGSTYSVIVNDANNCSMSDTISVFEPPALVFGSSSITNISCFGMSNGSINISASGGMPSLNYNLMPSNITNGSGSFLNLVANNFTVTVTDANLCTITTLVAITQPASLVFNTIVPTHILCNGGNNGILVCNSSGGTLPYTYTLLPSAVNNNTGIFASLTAGAYTVNVVDANGCTTVSSITITQPNPLSLGLINIIHPTCFNSNNGVINVQAANGSVPYSYTLLPINYVTNNGVFNSLIAGTYTVNVVDINGCTASLPNITLTVPNAVVIDSVTKQDVICYLDSNGKINIYAHGGVGSLLYSISPNVGINAGSGSFTNLSFDTYTVTVSDAIGCSISTSVTIFNSLQLATLNFTAIEPTCFGFGNGVLNIIASGGVPPISYSLNNSAFNQLGNFDSLYAGTYNLQIIDSKGCINDTVVVLPEPDAIIANILIDNMDCYNSESGTVFATALGGTPQYIYYINPTLAISSNGLFENMAIGIYTLTIKDSLGCMFDTLLDINPSSDTLQISFTKTDIGCYGFGKEGKINAIVFGGTSPFEYSWSTSPFDTLSYIDKLTAGKYSVLVTDANGCTQADTINIEVGRCCDDIFIPNAFTPNGDKMNDTWRLTTAAGLESVILEIYDRWGEKIYTTTDLNKPWDGNYKDKPMELGVFFYILKYTCTYSGKAYFKKGDLTLIR